MTIPAVAPTGPVNLIPAIELRDAAANAHVVYASKRRRVYNDAGKVSIESLAVFIFQRDYTLLMYTDGRVAVRTLLPGTHDVPGDTMPSMVAINASGLKSVFSIANRGKKGEYLEVRREGDSCGSLTVFDRNRPDTVGKLVIPVVDLPPNSPVHDFASGKVIPGGFIPPLAKDALRIEFDGDALYKELKACRDSVNRDSTSVTFNTLNELKVHVYAGESDSLGVFCGPDNPLNCEVGLKTALDSLKPLIGRDDLPTYLTAVPAYSEVFAGHGRWSKRNASVTFHCGNYAACLTGSQD
jgi:hypothetical protein